MDIPYFYFEISNKTSYRHISAIVQQYENYKNYKLHRYKEMTCKIPET
jgi:hypothetical protein